MKRFSALLLLIILSPILSGCGATLDTVDLSGKYYLYRYNNDLRSRATESFVTIDSYTWRDSGNVDFLLERNLSSRIGELTLNRYWREKWNGLELINYNVNIGNNKYLVGADFFQSHIDMEVRDLRGDTVPGLKHVSSNYHTSYDHLLLDDPSWTNRGINQTGKELYQFTEPNTEKKFLLSSNYETSFKVSRDIFIHPDTREMEERKENYYLNFQADLSLAYSQYLSGGSRLTNKDNKEVQINLNVFDRNLDGEFNQDDFLHLEYPSGLFFNNRVILPLNKPASVRKKSKTSYILTLSPPGPAPFMLNGFQNTRSISAAYSKTLLLKDDGSLWMWENQVQSGDKNVRSIGKSYKTAAVGDGFYLAVKEDGTVWSWGENSYGRPGDDTELGRKDPAPVVGLDEVIAVSAGKYHALALKADGTVWAWGKNSYGVLGDGVVNDGVETNRYTPVQVKGLYGVTHIIAGEEFSMAVKNDGTVWFWGNNRFFPHMLAQNEDLEPNIPVKINGLHDVKTLAAGNDHFMALKNDGTLWAWGDNSHGQLGCETEDNRTLPVQVLSEVLDIAAGADHSLAVKEDDTVWIWGNCENNLSGDGNGSKNTTPKRIENLAKIKSVVTGKDFCLAVDEDNIAWLWGDNPFIDWENPYVLTVEKQGGNCSTKEQ